MCLFFFKNDDGNNQQPENVENNQISGEENEYDVDDDGEEGSKEKEFKSKINTLSVSPSVGFSLQMNINPSPSSMSKNNSSSNNVIQKPLKYGADQATQQYHCETDGSESDQSEEPVPRRSSMDQPTQYVIEEDDVEEEGDIFVIILLSKSIT